MHIEGADSKRLMDRKPPGPRNRLQPTREAPAPRANREPAGPQPHDRPSTPSKSGAAAAQPRAVGADGAPPRRFGLAPSAQGARRGRGRGPR
eukprot:7271036-Pyramimonas_sp.AAC.1